MVAPKKRAPGLDVMLDVDAVDEFVASTPLRLEEPPAMRIWPTFCLIAAAAVTVGVLLGVAVHRNGTVLQVVLVASSLLTAITAVVWLECRRADEAGDDDT